MRRAVVGLGLFVLALFFVAAIALMAARDRQAVTRCQALGGHTYDVGRHCVIGGTTVSTR